MARPLRICVLGNFSGRNAGDIAILKGLIHDIEARFDNPYFLVPTINPRFIREHINRHGNVQPVSLLPWAMSAKIFGLPLLHATLTSDVILITDNILFDRRLWNPLYNYLGTLSLILPIAARRGTPVVLYNASLGPVTTTMGRRCLHRLMQACSLVILRDQPSQQLLERLDIPHPAPHFAADCALGTMAVDESAVDRIAERENLFQNPNGTVGFNVNTYLDVFLNKVGRHRNTHGLLDELARAIDRLIEQLDVDILFVITQVMDLKVAQPLKRRIKQQHRVKLISNQRYHDQQIAGVLRRCELLVGMRTHALILAASVGTPVVGIVSYPKTTGFMLSIEQGHHLIHFDTLDEDNLVRHVADAYATRHETRLQLKPIIEREKARAAQGADLLHDFLFRRPDTPPEHPPSMSTPPHERHPLPKPD
ncbi:polysaccharide pyruvyl transferase family protein [Phycisphaerales bacterium AB-hyl4]|uniref:Polysaccharide pyruvyl transferase family protein n=1 Tax=Natronomicrosphaera hydrolytica TaxID=3242702 RepID=A0ABV4U0J7_9BACT